MSFSPAETPVAAAFERIPLPAGELLFYPAVFADCAPGWFESLREQACWQQPKITLFGRQMLMPRLVAWYGEPGATYAYSGLRHEPMPWTKELQRIRALVETLLSTPFNSALVSLYRDGQDSVGWHSDDEPELGRRPCIASLSLGAMRRFELRPRDGSSPIRRLDLPPGSLLLMKGDTQRHWRHRVPRARGVVGPRINITFRRVHSGAQVPRPPRRQVPAASHGR